MKFYTKLSKIHQAWAVGADSAGSNNSQVENERLLSRQVHEVLMPFCTAIVWIAVVPFNAFSAFTSKIC